MALPSRNSDDTLLCVIVPMHEMDEQLANLQRWLTAEVLRFIKVILVIDKEHGTPTPNIDRLVKMLESQNLQCVTDDFSSPGLARNRGLEFALGQAKWIAFWDADDIPHVSKFYSMIAAAEVNDYSFAVGSFEVRSFKNDEVKATHKIKVANLSQFGRNVGLWRWAFRAERVKHLQFQRFKMGEDQDFFFEINPSSADVSYCEDIVYSYYKGREGQATSQSSSIIEIKDSYNYIFGLLWKNPKEVSKLRIQILLGQMISVLKYCAWKDKLFGVASIFRAIPTLLRYFHILSKGSKNVL